MARVAARRDGLTAMHFPDISNDGTGPRHDGAGGNGADEPLFGDARWIEERLEALRMREENGRRQEGG